MANDTLTIVGGLAGPADAGGAMVIGVAVLRRPAAYLPCSPTTTTAGRPGTCAGTRCGDRCRPARPAAGPARDRLDRGGRGTERLTGSSAFLIHVGQ